MFPISTPNDRWINKEERDGEREKEREKERNLSLSLSSAFFSLSKLAAF
jgi:hypothetical protein